MSSPRYVVFGATGPVGTSLVQILSTEEPLSEILAVSRAGPASKCHLSSLNLPNVTFVAGDAEDLPRVTELCSNATTVFSAIGFPRYETKYWADHWPRLVDNLIAASKSSGARLIFTDNLYAYGPGRDISPSTTTVAPSLKSKPSIRALIRRKLQEAMDADPDKVVAVGGADFFGPHVAEKSFLGDSVGGKIVRGQRAQAIGSVDVLHDFCYVEDFGRALYVTSKDSRAWGRFWVCPHAVKNKTVRQVAQDMGKRVDPDREVGIFVLGGVMLRVVSVFAPFLREMIEMLPWWVQDYTVDDSAFVETFGVQATDYDVALDKTMEFFKATSKQ